MADVSISYKGETIAQMDTTDSKTLKTSGCYCEGDISVDYNSPNTSGFLTMTTTEVVIGANTVTGGLQAIKYFYGLSGNNVAMVALLENPISKDELVYTVGSANAGASSYAMYRHGYRFRNGELQPIALADDYYVILREGARYKVWLVNANTTDSAPY